MTTPEGVVVHPWRHLSAMELAGASYALRTIVRAEVLDPRALDFINDVVADVYEEAERRVRRMLDERDGVRVLLAEYAPETAS